MEIDLPEVVAEVTAAFERYEQALVSNDVAALDAIFRNDPRTIRYGGGENLYGYRGDRGVPRRALAGRARAHAVEDRRSPPTAATSRSPRPCSTAPACAGKVGRQMQTWVRCPEGWRVVAAHVSVIDEPTGHDDRRASRRSSKCRARPRRPRASTRKPFTARPSASVIVPIDKRRRHRGNEAAEACGGQRPDLDLDRRALPVRHADQAGLRRRACRRAHRAGSQRGRRRLEQPRAERRELAVERHAGEMRAHDRDRDLAGRRQRRQRRRAAAAACRARRAAGRCRRGTRARSTPASRRGRRAPAASRRTACRPARIAAGNAKPQRSSRLTKLV